MSHLNHLRLGALIIGLMMCFGASFCTHSDTSTPSLNWHMVYKHDGSGQPIIGHVDHLISAIRQGCSIRVGWGNQRNGRTIEHLSDPIWIAVINDTLVSAHLDPQVLAHIDFDSLTVTYRDTNLLHQEWRVALTSSGAFDAVWYNIKEHILTRRFPQRHPMTWFAQGYQQDVEAHPFYEQ